MRPRRLQPLCSVIGLINGRMLQTLTDALLGNAGTTRRRRECIRSAGGVHRLTTPWRTNASRCAQDASRGWTERKLLISTARFSQHFSTVRRPCDECKITFCIPHTVHPHARISKRLDSYNLWQRAALCSLRMHFVLKAVGH